MPVYTYRCESCGIQFDKTQKFSDQPLTKCPECGKRSLRKVYTPVGIVFKGSGFYATDHRSPSGAPRLSSVKNDESKSSTTSEDKSEAALETKKEPAATGESKPALKTD